MDNSLVINNVLIKITKVKTAQTRVNTINIEFLVVFATLDAIEAFKPISTIPSISPLEFTIGAERFVFVCSALSLKFSVEEKRISFLLFLCYTIL